MANSKVSTYFNKHVLVFKIFGISLTGDESVTYKIYSFLLLFLTIYTYPVVAVIEIFRNDIEEMIDYVLYAIGGIIGILKTTAVLLNRLQLGNLLFKLEEAPFIPNERRGGKKERELMDSSVWLINMLTMFYWVSAFTIVGTNILHSITKRILNSDPQYWQLEYGSITMINATYSPNFEMLWLYQSTYIICLTVHFTTVDLIIGSVLGHVSIQFKILQNNLRRIVYNSYKEMIEDQNINNLSEEEILDQIKPTIIPWKYLRKSLKGAIDYHNAIINLANEMELSFTYALLCVFVCTLGLVCFTIYRLSVATSPLQFVRATIEVLCSILQIITICYWGEEIISQSQNVGQAAFESNFIGADPRFQKGLALIIRRSQTPVKITAGKFADVGLPTFTWIVRTSYSAFMILRSR